jgi:eukaryotic-like serine/threonine-protein kinase
MGASARTSPQLVSGPRLPERYRLRRHIASGGMASVWCAEDLLLGRSVAVKVLSERYAGDQFAVRRFKREARAAARVSAHPHVVTMFDVGDLEPEEADDADASASRRLAGSEPPAFIVMEYLSGGTVADAIRVGAVRQPQALGWLAEAASALDHAHERGVVHRDIKPGNFLLDNGRVLHVADFGIARLQSEDTITTSGQLFGTAAYLAPEQAMGLEATSATDRYSLAVTAFELLSGEKPFSATHFAAQARQHIDQEPPRASARDAQLPPGLDPVLIRGMAKDPADRYETASAFVAALDDALDGAPATAQTRPLGPRGAMAATPRPAAASGRPATPRPPVAAVRRPPRTRAPRSRQPVTPRGAAVPASRPPRSGRLIALAALAVAVLGVALVGLLGQSGSTARHKAAATGTRRQTISSHAPHRAVTAPAASSSTTDAATSTAATSSASTSSAASGSAAALQAQGHQDLVNGDYSAAIAADRQALTATNPSDLTYAYALYDLGVALMSSGNPSAAIPVLEQRLKIPNQTAVVQQTLDQARRQAGLAAPSTSAPAAPTGPPAAGPGHHDGHGNGGAGLAPGQAKHGGGD